MAKFDVYENRAGHPPLMLQYQSDFHDHLPTRLMIPLYPFHQPHLAENKDLVLKVMVNREDYKLSVPEIGAVTTLQMGKRVGNLREHDFDITRAVDFLMQGF